MPDTSGYDYAALAAVDRNRTLLCCYPEFQVRRAVHITFALLAVFLLVKPFDCFPSGQFTQKAVDCCKKGKCNPSTEDECCKGTLPGGKQILGAKTLHHAIFALDSAAAVAHAAIMPVPVAAIPTEMPAPPGSPPSSRISPPLLV